MKRLAFKKWIVEVDIIKTQRFYEQKFLVKESCDCLYCRNYYQACKAFPKKIKDLFNSLGLEPEKVTEVYELGQNDDGTYLYGGFYHIVGNLISVNDIEQDLPKWSLNLESLTEEFKFGFTIHLALVPKEFPQPVLQFEFNMNVPWVLIEKPDEN